MKTIISVPCWLGEPWRVERYTRWLAYYLAIKDKLGFDEIYLYDNASPLDALKQLNATVYDAQTNEILFDVPGSIVRVYRYNTFISRRGVWEIPYWWRWMRSVQELLRNPGDIEKVLFIDSDFYVLTSRLAAFIKGLSKGWTALWCTQYDFAETAMMFLCKDSFGLFLNKYIPTNDYYDNQSAEKLFTEVCVVKSFRGDRYGETNLPQTSDMDYYGQWHPGCPDLEFKP